MESEVRTGEKGENLLIKNFPRRNFLPCLKALFLYDFVILQFSDDQKTKIIFSRGEDSRPLRRELQQIFRKIPQRNEFSRLFETTRARIAMRTM
jgi:hypothetical protein